MDIKIEDYLSKEEIKEMCKDALNQKIREDMRNLNVNDIIANISNAEVEAMVDTYVGEDDFCKREIPNLVPIVEQWAKEHLVKTRQSEFLKMWPDAEISDDGFPSIAPCQLDVRFIHGKTQKDCEDRGVCNKCRRDFWLKEIG